MFFFSIFCLHHFQQLTRCWSCSTFWNHSKPWCRKDRASGFWIETGSWQGWLRQSLPSEKAHRKRFWPHFCHESVEKSNDCEKSERHSSHQSREKHIGGSQAPIYCWPYLCLSNWREALPNIGVSKWRWIVHASRKRRNIYGGHSKLLPSRNHPCFGASPLPRHHLSVIPSWIYGCCVSA